MERNDDWYDPEVDKLIKAVARDLSRIRGFTSSDQGDLAQRLWKHVLSQRYRFDPSRATWAGFATCIVRTRSKSIVRHMKAAKRDPAREQMALNAPVDDHEDGVVEAAQTIVDERSPAPDRNDLSHDLRTVSAKLTVRQREIMRRLADGETVSRISRNIRIEPEEAEREIAAIRICFHEHDLGEYLQTGVQA